MTFSSKLAISDKTFFTIFIIGICFIIPFIFSNQTLEPILSIRFLTFTIINSILCFYLFKKVIIGDFFNQIFFNKIIIAFFCVCIFGLISINSSINKYESIYELLRICNLLILLIISSHLFLNLKFYKFFVRCMVICALILSLIGLIQYFLDFRYIPGGWAFPFGTMANGNLYSFALFLLIPYLLYSIFIFNNKWKNISLFTLAIILIDLLLVQTRSTYIALIICFIAILFSLNYFNIKINNISISQKRLLFLLFFIYLLIFPLINQKSIIIRYNQTHVNEFDSDLQYASSTERLQLWEKSLIMFQDAPILGHGLGNWKIIFPNYGTQGMVGEDGYTAYNSPHNDFLRILSETGVFGFISFVSIFLLAFYYIFKILNFKKEHSISCIAIILLFGLLGFFIISLFSFPFDRIFHSIMLVLYISGIISTFYQSSDIKKTSTNIRLSYFLVFIMFSLSTISLLYSSKRFASDISHSKISQMRSNANWNGVIKEYNPFHISYYSLDRLTIPSVWYRGVAYFNLGKNLLALSDFEEALNLNPYNPHVLNNIATIYELAGKRQEAITYYERTIEIAPKFESPIINLAIIFYNTGNYKDVDRLLNLNYVNYKDERRGILLKKIGNKFD